MQEVLERFGQTIDQAREAMARFLADGLREGDWEEFYGAKKARYLGGEAFIERAKTIMKEPVRQEKRCVASCKEIRDFARRAEACFGVTEQDLQHPGKERRMSRIRQAFVEVGRKFYRYPVKELADYLGRSEPAISRMVRRRWESRQELQETRQLLTFLEKEELKQEDSVVEAVKC